MEWAEIKRRLVKEGTSVQVLADLEAIPYKTMYNRIMAHQVKDGVTYLTPENTKGMKKAKAISDTKQKQAKEKEKAAGLPEDAKASAEVVAIMEAVPDGVKVEIRPEVVPKLPEDIDNETIADILKDIKRSHADAVKELHRHEEILKQARNNEIVLRTLLIAMEQLAKGRKLPEVQ